MKRLSPVLILLCMAAAGCSLSRKAGVVRRGEVSPSLEISDYVRPEQIKLDAPRRDTLSFIDENGKEVFIMRAVRDENGEMVARDVLDASLVVASFKNVAERHGRVDLRFDIIVPAAMTDSRWQVRLSPVLYIMQDTLDLETVMVTGEDFRQAQNRGYARYGRFLESIDTNPESYLNARDFKIFVSRNAAGRGIEEMASELGVTRVEAVEHYTRMWGLRRAEHRDSRKDEMFRRYVKSPIICDGLRLDTVIVGSAGDIRYSYVQTIRTRPRLKKAEISLKGGVYAFDGPVCLLPESARLTYYISSLSTLADETPRYLTRVVERRAYANSVCWIEFSPGSAVLDTSLGHNASEIARIAGNLESIRDNTEFELDSVVVEASCSPEGSLQFNRRLSAGRGKAVCRHFGKGFIPREVPENWKMLDRMVEADSSLSMSQKEEYNALKKLCDLDLREYELSKKPYYKYLREHLYPHLRTVGFRFNMHRAGMVKDTVHTTEPDTLYMRGVAALKDRDYAAALKILRPYADINTALAYCALEYDASALSVLEKLPPSAKSEYMMALLYARKGDDAQAVRSYISACKMDAAFIHRGNLDPEISALVNKYELNEKLQ